MLCVSGRILGASRRVLGAFRRALGASSRVLGASRRVLGTFRWAWVSLEGEKETASGPPLSYLDYIHSR